MAKVQCAYCGQPATGKERDHVVPKCLYSSCQRQRGALLTVPVCRSCNVGFSNDETHFRGVMLLAGEPNEAVHEVWQTKMLRSLARPDGRKRAADLAAQMVPRQGAAGQEHLIYPDRDERVVRVLRKIVRGMSFHHFGTIALPEALVRVETLRYAIPNGFLDALSRGDVVPEVFEYWYLDMRGDPDRSFDVTWMLRIFERRWFIAWVGLAPGAAEP